MVIASPGSTVVPQRKPGDRLIWASLLLAQGVADELVEGAVEVAAAVEQRVGDGELLLQLVPVRRAHGVDVPACADRPAAGSENTGSRR
jgi:hypothetical protein